MSTFHYLKVAYPSVCCWSKLFIKKNSNVNVLDKSATTSEGSKTVNKKIPLRINYDDEIDLKKYFTTGRVCVAYKEFFFLLWLEFNLLLSLIISLFLVFNAFKRMHTGEIRSSDDGVTTRFALQSRKPFQAFPTRIHYG